MDTSIERKGVTPSDQLEWLKAKRDEYRQLLRLAVSHHDGMERLWQRWYDVVDSILREKYGA